MAPLVVGVILVVFSIGRLTLAQIEITLNGNLTGYSDAVIFERRFANVPSGFRGRIHQPTPSDACSYIQPLGPDFNTPNDTWCALVENYSSCPQEMVKYVRNAGYDLIIAYSAENERKVSHEVVNTLFPIVVVDKSYGAYLKENGLSNSTNGTITAKIDAAIIVSTFIVTFSFVLCLSCCCCCSVICCFRCCRRAPNNVTETQIPNIEERRRTMERLQRHERLARQELIESILRQLQDLQVDMRMQVPLGEQETRKLPTKLYCPGEDKGETCAICVEDFVERDMVRVLPCDHFFHTVCIDEWLTNHSALCPLCKMEVPRQQDRAGPMPVPQPADLESSDEVRLPSSDNVHLMRATRRSTAQSTYGSV